VTVHQAALNHGEDFHRRSTTALNRFLSDPVLIVSIAGFYTPMALSFTAQPASAVTVTTAWTNSRISSARLRTYRARGRALPRRGCYLHGWSIDLQAKRSKPPRACLPKRDRRPHFAQARMTQPDAYDQAGIPRPPCRLPSVYWTSAFASLSLQEAGRFARPRTFVFIRAVVKNPAQNPDGIEHHYLGSKQLCGTARAILLGWDGPLIFGRLHERFDTASSRRPRHPSTLPAGMPAWSYDPAESSALVRSGVRRSRLGQACTLECFERFAS